MDPNVSRTTLSGLAEVLQALCRLDVQHLVRIESAAAAAFVTVRLWVRGALCTVRIRRQLDQRWHWFVQLHDGTEPRSGWFQTAGELVQDVVGWAIDQEVR